MQEFITIDSETGDVLKCGCDAYGVLPANDPSFRHGVNEMLALEPYQIPEGFEAAPTKFRWNGKQLVPK